MSDAKEIKKLASAIKFINRYLRFPKKACKEIFHNHKEIAAFLFHRNYRNAYITSKELFEGAEEYIDKWFSLAYDKYDGEYSTGAHIVCEDAKLELAEFKKGFWKEKFFERVFNRNAEEKEKAIEMMAKIIHSVANRDEQDKETDLYPESKRVAKYLFSRGYNNSLFILSSFLERAKKFLEREKEKIEKEREEKENQYISGKTFILHRFEEKFWELERLSKKGKNKNE